MIEHKVNGYIAEYKSSQDLADGIRWILQDAQYLDLQKQAVRKVEECYSDKIVVNEYLQIYNSLTNNDN